MLKMVWLLHFFFLSLLGFTASGQESVKLLTLHNSNSVDFQALSHSVEAIAVNVDQEYLKEVSSSILMAEKWVRAQVLAYYPATDISTVLVGHNLLCNKNQEENLVLILPAIKNIYHSLIRWGLEREIKVSVSFPSNCLNPSSAIYRADLADSYIKPLLSFLQDTNSTYSVNPPPHLTSFSDQTLKLVTSHSESMKKIGNFDLSKINMIITNPKEAKPTIRKLSFIDAKFVEPFPARPTPLAPTHSPMGYSVPAYPAKSPLPPLVGTISPVPPFSLPFAPQLPPMVDPANPPFGFNLPPCNPSAGGAVPAPVSVPVPAHHNGLWCVAKPSVPADTLQQALDYACGEGAADCEAITPQGSCYFPDTIVAHASYAFNSYWQKNKNNGGTCGFGGTAMLVSSDPSFRHCRFLLN